MRLGSGSRRTRPERQRRRDGSGPGGRARPRRAGSPSGSISKTAEKWEDSPMTFTSFEPMTPYLPEARKLLRERYKFSTREAEAIISQVFWHFGREDGPAVSTNPRRALLSAVRKYAAARRLDEKTWATRDKNL